MKISSSALTDVGRKREHNEDNYYYCPDYFIFSVADGMGGAAAGEVASAIVAETLGMTLPTAVKAMTAQDRTDQNFQRLLASAIEKSNSRIQEEIRQSPEKSGMGSTCVLMAMEEGKVHLAHVGDSRIYRLRNNRLTQMTEDHSWVNESLRNGLITPEEAVNHRFKNVITRAVGTKETVQVETQTHFSLPGDIYMLCSDGLMAGKVSDETIEEVLRRNGSNVDASTSELISLANQGGGPDNITIIVVHLIETAVDPAYKPEASTDGMSRGTLAALSVLGILLAVAAAIALFKIMTFSPPPPPTLDPVPHITSESSVSLSGKCEKDFKVEVLVNGAQAATASASSDGTWKALIPLTADGSFTISARTLDASGNASSETNAGTIVRDTMAPPLEGLILTTDVSGVVTGAESVAIAGKSEPETLVEIELDDIIMEPVLVDSKGLFQASVNLKGLGDGEHHIKLRPRDAAGNAPSSHRILGFEYDTEAPPLPDFITPSGDTVNTTALTVRVKAREAAEVELKINDQDWQKADLERDDVFKKDFFGLEDGREHKLHARSRDKAGNSSKGERVVVFSVYTARPPAPKVDFPIQGSLVTSPFSVRGNASPGSRITLLVDGRQAGMIPTTGEKLSWETEIRDLADGPHVLKAQSEYHGAVSLFSDPISFTVDTTAPPLPTLNEGRAIRASESPIKLIGRCEPNALVIITSDQKNFKPLETTCNEEGLFNSPAIALSEGKTKLYLKARDQAGNTSRESNLVMITLDSTPPEAPVLENMQKYYLNKPVVFAGKAEPDSVVIFFLRLEAGKDLRFESSTDSRGRIIPVTQNLPVGSHTLVYWAVDQAGNESANKTTTLKVITKLPSAPYFPEMGKTVILDSQGRARISGRTGGGNQVTLACGQNFKATAQADDAGRFNLDMPLPTGNVKIEAFSTLGDDPSIRSEAATLELTVRKSEGSDQKDSSSNSDSSSGSSGVRMPKPTGQVDINSASAADMARILDIPESLARSIENLRTRTGNFTGLSQTLDIPEMVHYYESIKDYMKISSSQSRTKPAGALLSHQEKITRAGFMEGNSLTDSLPLVNGRPGEVFFRFRPLGRGAHRFIFSGRNITFSLLTSNPVTPEQLVPVDRSGSGYAALWDTSSSSTLMPDFIIIAVKPSQGSTGSDRNFEIKVTFTSKGTGDGF